MTRSKRSNSTRAAFVTLTAACLSGGGCVISEASRYEAHLAAVVEPITPGTIELSVAADAPRDDEHYAHENARAAGPSHP